MIFQILLDDESAHGVADQNRRAGQLLNCICNIFDEIGNSDPAQFISSFTVAVSAQVDGMGSIAVLSEVIEKILHPNTRLHATFHV